MIAPETFYKAANLRDNPFRTNPAAEADPRRGIWIGYLNERNTLTKYLQRSLSDNVGNINFVMIYGELGNGKSHALLWSQHLVLVAENEKYNSVAYYIQSLKRDKGKMSFVSAFNEDIVGKSNLAGDLLIYKQFVSECIIEYKRDNALGPDVSNDKVAERLIPSMDMRNTLTKILKCETEDNIRGLLGTDTDYSAMLLFCQIVNLFVHPYELAAGKKRYKKCVYLFIDEMDVLGEVPPKEARDVNALLRHIYDLCPNCFFLGLGFTATAAELGVLFDEFVLSRVSKQITLQFMQPVEAQDFIRQILNTVRIDNKKHIDYFPFTEDAVGTIVSRMVSITPRKIVNQMLQILEECRLADLDPSKAPISTTQLDEKEIWEMVD